jgi:cytoskeletal protein CcmA (bactofilin family)
MWKPTNQPPTPNRPSTPEPERPVMSTPTAPAMPEPAAAPRPVSTTTADQATIGKSLVIKGEVTGSESLYIDGRVEGSINLAGNRVTIGRNGVVAANINAREIVVLGKVRGNLTASDRVDIRSDGSLTGDVVAARISIEDGAFFKGGIDIRKGGQANQSQKPEEKKEAATPEPAVAARA